MDEEATKKGQLDIAIAFVTKKISTGIRNKKECILIGGNFKL